MGSLLQFKPRGTLRSSMVLGTDIKHKDEYTFLHKAYLKSVSTFNLTIDQVILMYNFGDSQVCFFPISDTEQNKPS